MCGAVDRLTLVSMAISRSCSLIAHSVAIATGQQSERFYSERELNRW
jgi:hypothetical protein